MDPKLLFQLCEVIEHGSMSQAAASLQVTQPTLTRNVKAIEEIVGAPVLRRGRFGVTPTDIGERLAEHGRSILHSMAEADNAVNHWKTGLVGEITLGVGPMFSGSLLTGFFAAHPMEESNFTLKVVTTSTASLVQKLRKGDIDMAIMPVNPKQSQQALLQIPLFPDQVCVLAGSASPLCAIQGKVPTQQLPAEQWIAINLMSRNRHIHNQIARMLDIDDIVPKFVFEGDITAPMQLMRDSKMLALVPRRLAQDYVDKGGLKILETDVQLPVRNIALWISKEKQNVSYMQVMMKKIISYYGEADFASTDNTDHANNDHLDTEIHTID